MIKVQISEEYQGNDVVCSFLAQLPSMFDFQGETLYNERNVVKLFCLENSSLKTIVVKRYKKLNILQRIIYSFFRASKAKRAFNNSVELRKREIDSPKEIAYLEEYKNNLLLFGYYLSEFTDAIPIRGELEKEVGFNRSLASAFASFVASLHEKGILHHDLNSTNVLYSITEGEYCFSLIDINRMEILPTKSSFPLKTCFDNLTRFTGRMDLFEYVAEQYIRSRKWNGSLLTVAINIKREHDKAWRRRKAFLKNLKFKK